MGGNYADDPEAAVHCGASKCITESLFEGTNDVGSKGGNSGETDEVVPESRVVCKCQWEHAVDSEQDTVVRLIIILFTLVVM
jgi:hypothetical protein